MLRISNSGLDLGRDFPTEACVEQTIAYCCTAPVHCPPIAHTHQKKTRTYHTAEACYLCSNDSAFDCELVMRRLKVCAYHCVTRIACLRRELFAAEEYLYSGVAVATAEQTISMTTAPRNPIEHDVVHWVGRGGFEQVCFHDC